MKKITMLFLLGLLLVFSSCSESIIDNTAEEGILVIEEEEAASETDHPNILLIIADDMGMDATPGFMVTTQKPTMPTLERMMDSGIKFTNLWSYALCSPTRASIITGKYDHHTGVSVPGDYLSTTEISLFDMLDSKLPNIYAHAVIGKWHLGNKTDYSHPNDLGVQTYSGNLGGGLVGGNNSYWDFDLIINKVNTRSQGVYGTTKYTDLAVDWIADQTKPWFAWVAYNAAHTPFHLPPANLHADTGLTTEYVDGSEALPYYLAMLEAMDTEMGRLIASLSPEEKAKTVLLFIGDNGTPAKVAQSPFGRGNSKGAVKQGGINVPMVVSGYGVSRIGASSEALVTTTDLYTTILEIAGITMTSVNDSKSFKEVLSSDDAASTREYAYVNVLGDTGSKEDSYAIRNAMYKLIVRSGSGDKELYNLLDDSFETKELNDGSLTTEETNAIAELSAKALEIQGE
jgi:arylsulfatase A-like enzyme